MGRVNIVPRHQNVMGRLGHKAFWVNGYLAAGNVYVVAYVLSQIHN